ncbi:RNAse P Rpr2/Rpp21/SNM1 subunit domain-containing protein, partial [Geopyxis carbonaria]
PRGSRPTGPNAHLSLRLSHLYRAASATLTPDPSAATSHLSRLYVGTLRSVAKKNVLRLAPELKRTLCKRCDAVLVPGVTAETRRENKSKGGRKGWAEVVVVECRACGGVKRFAVGMEGFVRREKKGAGKG